MAKVMRNKKVVGALVALALALASATMGLDFGSNAGTAITEGVCQVVACE